ncbi:Uncharacterised protein [Streptococcus pneumoniae]|nr:Uncharacterised protein [Streptococcus pneumoniae]CKH31950.1 Uncharacterised protein [Streptococcus pneumoniae]
MFFDRTIRPDPGFVYVIIEEEIALVPICAFGTMPSRNLCSSALDTVIIVASFGAFISFNRSCFCCSDKFSPNVTIDSPSMMSANEAVGIINTVTANSRANNFVFTKNRSLSLSKIFGQQSYYSIYFLFVT